jgi:hypothetical protein
MEDRDLSPDELEGIKTFAEIIVNTMFNNPHLMEPSEPEIFKVKIDKKSSRDKTKPTAHLLVVRGTGEHAMYQIDNEMPESKKNFAETESKLKVIKKVTDMNINKPRIHLTWNDEEGDSYDFVATNPWDLKSIFDQFEFLADGFGFELITREDSENPIH